MKCTACSTENPEKARFCLECGAPLILQCIRCGARLPTQSKFCLECGARLDEPAVASDTSVGPAATPPAPGGDAAAALQRLVPREYAERLLASSGQATAERRTVTILFCDIKGSTALAGHLDPEDVMEIMNGAFEYLVRPIYRHEGTLARLMGDAILAFFGAPVSREDDPERAVRAALEIQAGIREYASKLARVRGISDFNVRVGINTGLVVVGEVGSDLRVEYTAMGDTINLAARMEQNAPPGEILITYDTYLQVRESFDVDPQPPLLVKGHVKPLQTYLVVRARPVAFRPSTRGVEGVEVPMIGRDAELAGLQAVFARALVSGERQCVTVLGEAGLGKSRLLFEFDGWLASHESRPITFKGRATPQTQRAPYALLRDLFTRHCSILESDSAALVRGKLEDGIGAAMEPSGDGEMKAHFIGHLLGFDLSDSPHLRGALGDPRQLHDRARMYLADFYRSVSAAGPVVVFLEDVHWADDSSLDAVTALAASLGDCLLVFAFAARPALLERRPRWGHEQPWHTRINLEPLAADAGRRLVAEILRKVDRLPKTLHDLVAAGAEGNPFFAEELIKMLIDDGVIVKGEAPQGCWTVDLARLTGARVPTNLKGVLQARLDHLALEERTVLQQASVVGRRFWDQAVVKISSSGVGGQAGPDELPRALATLAAREMIFRDDPSAFVGAQEYVFKHGLLREVAYEGLLKRLRRVFHGLAADWLIEQGGERTGELTDLIGAHLELAGRAAEAASYLARAAASAAARFANEAAYGYYRRALSLCEAIPEGQGGAAACDFVARLNEELGDLCELLSRKPEGRTAYRAALAAIPAPDRVRRARIYRKLATIASVNELGERESCLDAADAELNAVAAQAGDEWWEEWLEIAFVRMSVYRWAGRFEALDELAARVRPVLEARGSPQQRAGYFRWLSRAMLFGNRGVSTDESINLVRAALAADREAGNLRQLAIDQFMLGMHLLFYPGRDDAEPELRLALDLANQVGDAWQRVLALTYLVILYRFRNDVESARAPARESLDAAVEAGLDFHVGTGRAHLAWIAWRDGDYATALELGQAALPPLLAVDYPYRWIVTWPLLAVALESNDLAAAAEYARMLLHPSQQPLPAPLTAHLQSAADAIAIGRSEESRQHLAQAATLAARAGYI